MLQRSCRTVWLMSRCIPTYLNISLQGDRSAHAPSFWKGVSCIAVLSLAYSELCIMQALALTTILLNHEFKGMFAHL